MSRDNGRGGMVGGLALIILGLIFLAGQSTLIPWEYLWPFLVIAIGVLFFLGALTGGRGASGLAVPGSILSTVGLILLYQNTFNRWETWAYAWTLIPAAVGAGLVIHGRIGGEENTRRVGAFLAGLGLVLFLVFGGLAEVFLGLFGWRNASLIWPLFLIGLGLYLLIYRTFYPRPRSGAAAGPTAGSGQAVPVDSGTTEVREAGSFTRLAHRGVGEVRLRQGERDAVEIEAPAHVRARLVTRIVDDTLEIGYRQDWWDWTDWFSRPAFRPLRFNVTMREIRELSLSGAGSLTASGFTAGRLQVTLSGAGNIKLDAVAADDLSVQLKSVGNIEIGGRVETQLVELTGAGNYNGGSLESRQAVVRLRGVGNATVWAREELAAEIGGLGKIGYYGQPRVTQRINGLGRLDSLGMR